MGRSTTSWQLKKKPLWRNQDFLLLWIGQTVSLLGTNISTLALPLLILAITHSAVQAGLLATLRAIPYLLFSLPVGALIDRWNRKTVMIYSDALRWLTLGSIPLALILGWLSLPQIAIVVFIEGTANVFFSIAQISALPRVVAQEQVARAYGLDQAAESTATLLGPGLSGFIIGLARTTVLGAALAYLVDSISYLVSVISLSFMRVPFQSERAAKQKLYLWAEIREGLRFLWHQRLLRTLALLTMTVNFLQAATPLALIVLMQNQQRINVPSIGLVFSAGGIGGLVGGLIAPWVKQRLRLGHIMLGSVVIWSLAAALLAIGTNVAMFMLGEVLINLTWPVYAVTLVSYRLSLVPDELQGRINSSFRMLTYGSESLGPAVGGLLLGLLGTRSELAAISTSLALCFMVAIFTGLRKA